MMYARHSKETMLPAKPHTLALYVRSLAVGRGTHTNFSHRDMGSGASEGYDALDWHDIQL